MHEEVLMWWVVIIVAAVAILAFYEWRSRNKPLVPGLGDHWGAHSAALNHDRPLTGGHGTDERS
jgi:hypothetical protein